MFSAIYLVCMSGEPCRFFVDPLPYPTEEVCEVQAMNNITTHTSRVLAGEIPPFEAEYQCIGWGKA